MTVAITGRRRGRQRQFEPLLVAWLLACGCSGPEAHLSGEPATAPLEPIETAPDPTGRQADGYPSGAPAPVETADRALDGRLVWESNRSGAWRIWERFLPTGEPRQLTADEPDRQHCCPHLSPDGRRLAYLSLPAGGPRYDPAGERGVLRLRDLTSGRERQIGSGARTYFEHRAAVWRGTDELIYIGADGHSYLHDLATDEARRLTAEPLDKHGWLLNPTLTHATTGRPIFAPYDPTTREVAERRSLGGCQPYFSADGRWGYWTAGAGGPLKRVDLASGDTATILGKNDRRLPDGLGYLYFPMLSADGRLLAFAASRGEHDHFKGDYEVFVVPVDPSSLELEGAPVRLTFDSATDRYPDVFVAELPLGHHGGEAPLTVRFEAPRTGEWSWDLGDGVAMADGRRVSHTYERAGIYTVEARRGELSLRGQVRVTAAAPPRVSRHRLLRNGAEIEVVFDEPIVADEAVVTLESGGEVASWSLTDERTLEVLPVEPIRRPLGLRIENVSDRAARPNRAPTIRLELQPPLWPSDREGLLFLWQSADSLNLVPDADSELERETTLEPRGLARLNHAHTMVLDGGSFAASREEGNRLRWGLQATNELSIELTVRPRGEPRGTLLAFADGRRANFVLAQSGRRLHWRQRTGSVGRSPLEESELFRLPAGRASHVVITYTPGELVAYLDGEAQPIQGEIRGDFFHWRSLLLTVGGRDGRWRGEIEGLAIYDRVLSPSEVTENSLRYREVLDRRRPVQSWSVAARRVERSPTPTLEEISPYRQALVTAEYEVVRWLEGEPRGRRIRVVEWAVADGKPLPTGPGAGDRLRLERFEDNPQLAALFLADALVPAPDLPLFYLVDHE